MASVFCGPGTFATAQGLGTQLIGAYTALQNDVKAATDAYVADQWTREQMLEFAAWQAGPYAAAGKEAQAIAQAIASAATWTVLCDLEPAFRTALNNLASASARWAKLSGRADPVSAFKALVDQAYPPAGWGLFDYLKWALIIGGGYLVYKTLMGDRPLSSLFGDDEEIPRHKLPRYAGGSRR